MSILSGLFGKPKNQAQPPAQTQIDDHGVTIHFSLLQPALAGLSQEEAMKKVHALEDALSEDIAGIEGSIFDGNEFKISDDGRPEDCSLFFYGPDADALLDAMTPTLREVGYGPYDITKWYGNVVLHPDLEPVHSLLK